MHWRCKSNTDAAVNEKVKMEEADKPEGSRELRHDLQEVPGKVNEKAQNLISDNLEDMRYIVFRIREDEEFAKSIYADCPRLQSMLGENPDLRPIFEDPKLIRINFEKVYRDQGGVLPEDEDENEGEHPNFLYHVYESMMSKISIITSHPLFKFFKVLLLIRKVLKCFGPSGSFSFIKGLITGFLQDPDDTPDAIDGCDGNPANLELRMQLNAAAEHLEDPEIQEKFEDMLDNPGSMDEAIENNPELKALRDQNKLVSALMSDPDKMRIVGDPDNLRALATAPDLIEKDFADPGGFSSPDDMTKLNNNENARFDRSGFMDSKADRSFQNPANQSLGKETNEILGNVQPESPDEGGDIFQEISDSREDLTEKRKSLRVKGLPKRSADEKEDENVEAKIWTHAAMGVLGGQALSALGISTGFLGDLIGVGSEDEGIGLEIAEIEVDGGTQQSQITSRSYRGRNGEYNEGVQNNDEGGLFGSIVDAAKGIVIGTAFSNVISADQLDLLSRVQEKIAEKREDVSRGINSEETAGDIEQANSWGAIKSGLVAAAIGGIVGQDVVNSVLELKDDTQEIVED
jgi:hypothetical protein